MAEAGVSGYQVILWHGLVGPKGMPRAIVERVNREVNEALEAKDMEQLFSTDGVSPAGGTPEQLQSHIKADIERWRTVVQRAGMRVK